MRQGLASVARGLSRLVRLPSVIESTAREQERLRQEHAAAADVHDLDAAQQADDGLWMPPVEGDNGRRRPQQSA